MQEGEQRHDREKKSPQSIGGGGGRRGRRGVMREKEN